MHMELTKSFILLEDELAYILDRLGLAQPAPFDPVAAEARLLEKRILRREGGHIALEPAVRLLAETVATAERVVSCGGQTLYCGKRLAVLLEPYPLCARARRLTPYPSPREALRALSGQAEIREGDRRQTVPLAALEAWLEAHQWISS